MPDLTKNRVHFLGYSLVVNLFWTRRGVFCAGDVEIDNKLYTSPYTKSPKPDRKSTMNHTQEERLGIGCRIYNNEITQYEAAAEYGISDQTARTSCRSIAPPTMSPQEQETKRPYPHTHCNRACRHENAGVDDNGRID